MKLRLKEVNLHKVRQLVKLARGWGGGILMASKRCGGHLTAVYLLELIFLLHLPFNKPSLSFEVLYLNK